MSLDERNHVILISILLITSASIFGSIITFTPLFRLIAIRLDFYHISSRIALEGFLVFATCRLCLEEHDVSRNPSIFCRINRTTVFLPPLRL